MRKSILSSILSSILISSLACNAQQVAQKVFMTFTPSPSATPSPTPTLAPSPTMFPASATDRETAVVRQPVVRVRDAADGLPTGDYITEGQEVTILRIDGDWVQIQNPPGWVWIGCLEGLSEKKCEAK